MACTGLTVDYSDLACQGDGDCKRGWICHPLRQICVHRIEVGCDGSHALCPSSVATGDACDTVDAFLPCAEGLDDCSAGCRDCLDDRRWSECRGCVPSAEICNGLDDDCDGETDELTGTDLRDDCRSRLTPPSYVAVWECAGSCVIAQCAPGHHNINGRSNDGCEYACESSGVESCNGLDDDCDGTTDDVENLKADCDLRNGNPDHVASYSCAGGTCAIASCDAGWVHDGAPDENVSDGCNVSCTDPTLEVCNGEDDDCNGIPDDGENLDQCVDLYLDADNDGYGVRADTRCLCAPTGNYRTEQLGDCADDDPASHEGVSGELCDGDDNDCVGGPGADEIDADGDGFVVCSGWDDTQGNDGSVLGGGDCDDGTQPSDCGSACSPARTEGPQGDGSCSDGYDNDCDGATDGADTGCDPGGWWNDAWGSRIQIVFDNTGQGNLDGFPLLVVIEDPPVSYSRTANDGADVRFIDADQTTVLSHEIEVWNESGKSWLWVKVPRIDGGSTTDSIWMYYDNSQASDVQDAAAVWSEGYVGVWHLSSASTTFVESSGQSSAATTVGGATGTWQGRIAGGAEVNIDEQEDDSLRSDHASTQSNLTALTLEAWIRPEHLNEFQERIVQKRNGENQTQYGIHYGTWDGSNYHPKIQFRFMGKIATSTAEVIQNAWNYVALTYDITGNAGHFHIRGQPPQSFSVIGAAIDWSVTQQIDIGGVESRGQRGFTGRIDEVRISNVVRSVDWLRAQRLNVNAPGSGFVTLGTEEIR